MNGRYLLDTNIVIAFLTGEEAVVQCVDATDEFYVSSVVLGELFYGAFNSTNRDKNISRIKNFIRDTVAIPCDHETSEWYGEIKTSLRRKGRPIPDNDIWIAATVKQHSLTLVTRDDHFTELDNLLLVRW